MRTLQRHHRGFSLVELLVAIGIITLLLGLLLGTVQHVRARANLVKCQSNLRQIGVAMQMYVNQFNGWMYPAERGATVARQERWPIFVLQPPVWNPPVMLCPSDDEPVEEHSYLINNHLTEKGIKWTSRDLGGKSSSEVILMGEKKSGVADYYMEAGEDFNTTVELYRHGTQAGSNYLFMDWHVEPICGNPQVLTGKVLLGIAPWDPWDVATHPNSQ